MVESFKCQICGLKVSVEKGNIHTGACDLCFDQYFTDRKQELEEQYSEGFSQLLDVKRKHYKRVGIVATVRAVGYKRLAAVRS